MVDGTTDLIKGVTEWRTTWIEKRAIWAPVHMMPCHRGFFFIVVPFCGGDANVGIVVALEVVEHLCGGKGRHGLNQEGRAHGVDH